MDASSFPCACKTRSIETGGNESPAVRLLIPAPQNYPLTYTGKVRVIDPLSSCPKSSTFLLGSLTALRAHLRSLPTPTAIQSTLSTLTRLMLPYTAYSIGASHLVLGTTLTSLSISLISSISQGGGFVVPQAIQEEWIPPFVEHAPGAATSWRGEVRLIRPLRDVGLKECTAWVWWHQLSVVGKQRVVVLSSTELFYVYGQTLEGCATLSTGRPLFDLSGVFKKWLRVYAGEHAPRIGSAVINPSLRFAASTQNCASSMLVSPPSMLTPPLLQTSSQPPLIAAVASANTAAHASTL
jgi:hypothetical protein